MRAPAVSAWSGTLPSHSMLSLAKPGGGPAGPPPGTASAGRGGPRARTSLRTAQSSSYDEVVLLYLVDRAALGDFQLPVVRRLRLGPDRVGVRPGDEVCQQQPPRPRAGGVLAGLQSGQVHVRRVTLG